jgi:dihydrofolate synthase/folylpolyglutamate synthase
LKPPVVSIIAVPNDKDYKGVYAALGAVSQSLILTETERNPILHWLPEDEALAVARTYNQDVRCIKPLDKAVEQAKTQVGESGTILIVGTQSIVADATMLWGKSYEVI